MEAKKYMDQGLLVPDELTVKILLDRVAQDDCKNGYVLDGFPRTIPQAEVLDKALTELGDQIDYAINVDAGREYYQQNVRKACLRELWRNLSHCSHSAQEREHLRYL